MATSLQRVKYICNARLVEALGSGPAADQAVTDAMDAIRHLHGHHNAIAVFLACAELLERLAVGLEGWDDGYTSTTPRE